MMDNFLYPETGDEPWPPEMVEAYKAGWDRKVFQPARDAVAPVVFSTMPAANILFIELTEDKTLEWVDLMEKVMNKREERMGSNNRYRILPFGMKMLNAPSQSLDGDDLHRMLNEKMIVKCSHCGQFGVRRTQCKHCNAPIE